MALWGWILDGLDEEGAQIPPAGDAVPKPPMPAVGEDAGERGVLF